MPITIDEIHSEIKKHIVAHPKMWTRMELEYGAMLIQPEDIITKTFYVEKGIVKVYAYGKYSETDVIVNLFAAHNPCMPLSPFMGMPAKFTAVVIGKENIVHAIDIVKLHTIHRTQPRLNEALTFIRNKAYNEEFAIKDLAQCKPFERQFKKSFIEFPCLADMQKTDIMDFFGVDRKTLEKELLRASKKMVWQESILDIMNANRDKLEKKNSNNK